MDEAKKLRIVDQAIRSHIVRSSLSLKEAAQRANMSPSTFLRWWSSEALLLDEEQMDAFLRSTGYSLPSLLERPQALTVVGRNTMSPDLLPEKYGHAPLSFVSSSKHILSYIELQYGRVVSHHLLNRLKVPYQYFENLQNRISLAFFEDLLAEYTRLGNSPDSFNQLSKALFITVEDGPIQSIFPQVKTYEEAFTVIRDSTGHFDENFHYSFEITNHSAKVRCRPSEALAETTKSKTYGSDLLYAYRSHLFGNMLYLCGMKPLKMQTEKCISQGDTECVYTSTF